MSRANVIRQFTNSLALGAMVVLAATPGLAADIPKAAFSSQIRPLLSSKCFSCHGPDESARKAKLRLDVRDEAIKERKGIRAIVPGNLAESELVRRITTQDPDDVMPPPKSGNTLTPSEIALLQRWIQEGAEYSQHWAFVKPAQAPLPEVKDKSWPRNEIDYFILDNLSAHQLAPSPRADRYSLIRRLSLDLTGLPPTSAEIEAFVKDELGDAYERLVDRLLDSPAYGERWARLWLDLARYADSAGYGSDPLRPNMWPWRDWVIRSLNANMPFDQFTLEQMAGDLLPEPTREQQIATGFHRNTMTNTEGGTDDEEFRVAAVKDRANVTAQVWMGLTMGCAQCHSHKFDPISQREYYQFYAFFNETEDNDQPDERPTLPLPTEPQREKMERLKNQIARLEQDLAKTTPEFARELAEWEKAQEWGTDWRPLQPVAVRSLHGAPLAIGGDWSISPEGGPFEADAYTVLARAPLTNVTALRLEWLPNPDGPDAGRISRGNRVVLTEFEAAVRSAKMARPSARFVRVELPGTQRVLSLAEVQVWSGIANIARQGQASQSTTQDDAGARRAIDGNTSGNFSSGSTTLTQFEDNPWWEVDLGREYPLEEISVWNRTDRGLGTRLVDFKIRALDAERKMVWERGLGPSPNPVTNLRVPEEKNLKLQNASADYADGDYAIGKAIDGKNEAKNGWSVGDRATELHVASFEAGQTVEARESLLILNVKQSFPTNHSPFRFRLAATSQPLPVRELPEKIKSILAIASASRTEKQQQDVAAYFRGFAPSLAQGREQLRKLQQQLDGVKPVALPVMKELAADKRRETKLLNKGNFLDPGEKVEAGVPGAFHSLPKDLPASRLGLARWLMDRENPLTARVAVNRLWAQIFGAGIVETEEDFGTQGSMPTHPQLLDWLAVEFMKRDWNMKSLLKLIVMSAAYQQSSRITPELLEKDPANRLYSRGTRRRLDAEMVRDQALALSGLLSRKVGGPSVYPPQPDGLWRAAFNGERSWATSKGEDRYRRGLYTFWRRTVPYPSMATFDAPSRETCTVRRIPTNTPLQAFVTMNDPVYVECSQALGRRLVREGGSLVADRIRFGLRLCLGRPAQDEQVQALAALYEKELEHYRSRETDATKLATEPIGSLPPGLSAAEAAAWTSVANVLLNLDGVLTKS